MPAQPPCIIPVLTVLKSEVFAKSCLAILLRTTWQGSYLAVCCARHKAICRNGSSGNGDKKRDNRIILKEEMANWKHTVGDEGKSKIDFRALNSGCWENYY